MASESEKREDLGIVEAAIRDGRVEDHHRDFWISSLNVDRYGTRAVLAAKATSADIIQDNAVYKSWDF